MGRRPKAGPGEKLKMSKLVTVTTAVLLSTGLAVGPAFAKKHHHHHMAAAEPQVMLPAPLIGGAPIRMGANCYTTKNMDSGAGFASACKK
jgi:hypothetical protein